MIHNQCKKLHFDINHRSIDNEIMLQIGSE